MRRRLLLVLPLLVAPSLAQAQDRRLFLSSFSRLRVEGAVRVTVAGGRSPGGSVAAADPDAVEVRQSGETVTVRRPIVRASGAPTANGATPIAVTLATPGLAAVTVVGAGAVAATGMKGERIDLSVAGTGEIAVADAAATELTATAIGAGHIAVAGRVTRARLVGNGSGSITADALDAAELFVRLDGPGAVTARARYTANVTNVGLGSVTVAGNAKCTVQSVAGGPVTCGAGPAR